MTDSYSYILRVKCALCGAIGEWDNGTNIPSTHNLPPGWLRIYRTASTSARFICPAEGCQAVHAEYRAAVSRRESARHEHGGRLYGPVAEAMRVWDAENPKIVPPWEKS